MSKQMAAQTCSPPFHKGRLCDIYDTITIAWLYVNISPAVRTSQCSRCNTHQAPVIAGVMCNENAVDTRRNSGTKHAGGGGW